jgi:hypothetical protein
LFEAREKRTNSARRAEMVRVLGGTLPPSQYAGWTAGDPVALAHPPPVFSGEFSPSIPPKPAVINTPPDGLARPQPRRWQAPIAWNMPSQPGTEGIRLSSFQTLRAYADMSSIVRACIDKRVEEIMGLEWDIVPTMEAELAMADIADRKDFQERRIKALRFFSRPDPEYDTYHSWLRALLEEVFVIDALSIYIAPPRVPGKGLFGSNLAALALIAGDTIRPMVDVQGGRPQAPAVAFQQYIYGVPRVDLVDVVNQSELDEELGLPEAELRGDQLLYLPYRRRTNSPYGHSHVEACLVPTGIELSKQQYALSYYKEGNVPASWIEIGNADTPQQVKQWQDSLDATIGDTAARHQVTVLPAGSHAEETKPNAFTDAYDMSNKEEIFAAFGLTAMDMGMLPGGKSAGLSGGKGMAEANQSEGVRASTKPLIMFLKRALFDMVLQQFAGQGDMQWHWKGVDPPADQEKKDVADIAAVAAGTLTRDEYRTERGQQAFGLPLTKNPTVVTPTGGLVNLADPTAPTGPTPAASGDEAAPPGDGDDAGGSAGSGGTQRTNAPDKPKPTPDGASPKETPLHDSMADQKPAAGARTGKSMSADLRDELTKLMNYQRHGKPITKFQSQHIAPELMHYIQTGTMPIKDVIGELERSEDPAYKTVSDDAALAMQHVWLGDLTQAQAFDIVNKTMQDGAPFVLTADIEPIARSLTAGTSSADCLAALKQYYELVKYTPGEDRGSNGEFASGGSSASHSGIGTALHTNTPDTTGRAQGGNGAARGSASAPHSGIGTPLRTTVPDHPTPHSGIGTPLRTDKPDKPAAPHSGIGTPLRTDKPDAAAKPHTAGDPPLKPFAPYTPPKTRTPQVGEGNAPWAVGEFASQTVGSPGFDEPGYDPLGRAHGIP